MSCNNLINLTLAACAATVIAGCGSVPGAMGNGVAAVPTATRAQMVAAIRAAAGDGDGELSVQPLRDSRVEDLRVRAASLEGQGDVVGAAAALDAALEVVPDDPALLQERAEVALLQGDTVAAGRLAERAYALGSQVGPLCRRHWATIEQLRLNAGDGPGAADARTQIAGCRVAGPERY